MATAPRRPEPGQPDITEELRHTDQPKPDAPAIAPLPGSDIEPGATRPAEDGGVAQHPVHDSDVEDLDPEDYEDLTNEVEKTGIVPERR